MLIAAGGTAGHVLPGICIGEAIVSRGTPRSEVHFVGSVNGIENRLVPEAGFGFTALRGRGLKRSLTLSNLITAVELLRAVGQALKLLRTIRPAVVIGLGGWASVACGIAAKLLQVPLLVVEQNAVPGLANKLLSRLAKGTATAFESTPLTGTHWTGNPVRPGILAVDPVAGRAAACAALNVDWQRLLVVAIGGSLGSSSINDSVSAALTLWNNREDLHLIHICGARDFPRLVDTTGARHTEGLGGLRYDFGGFRYDLVEYREDMATVYAAADLVVSRAGATTVAELAATGVPALLVPLPGAPGDHQTANARRLADTGAAVIIDDGELDGHRLVTETDALLEDPDTLDKMRNAGKVLTRPDAAGAVVDLAEAVAKRPRPSSPASGTSSEMSPGDNDMDARDMSTRSSHMSTGS